MAGSPINRLEPHWPKLAAGDGRSAPAAADRFATTLRPWVNRLETFLGEHPAFTVAAAAAAGVLLGWFVKRK